MSCSADSTDKSDRELADAVNHLVSGKRQLLVSDYVAAVASLQEACQIFSKKYGETANECGEPYLYYGKALLEYSRMETGVLGNALQGVSSEGDDSEEDEDEEEEDQVENPDEVTGEEREQIIQQVGAAIDENSRDLEEKMVEMQKNDSDKNCEDSAQDTTQDSDDMTEGSESTGEKSQDESATPGNEAGPSTSTGVTKEDTEEDVTNLQLAWEMLELSKVIFTRQAKTDKTKEMKVAEVLLKLGEVSIESENYGQAVEDLTACLNIQRRHLEPHDRSLAETLYQLGLATSFNNQYEVAIDHFTSSMKVIEDRINFLKQCQEDRQSKDSKSKVPNETKRAEDDAKDNKAAVKVELNAENNSNCVKDCVTSSSQISKKADEDASNSDQNVTTSGQENSKVEDNEAEKKIDSDAKTGDSKDAEEKEEKMDTSTENDKTGVDSSADAGKSESKDESENVHTGDSVEQSETPDDPWQDTKQEIEELEGLIPDIKTKIEDTEDMMKNALQSIKEAALQRLSEATEQSPVKSEEKGKAVSNISHLVKRKRKPEDESSGTSDLKKPRPSEELEENHVNGDTVVNGNAKSMETEESKVKVGSVETKPEAEQTVA